MATTAIAKGQVTIVDLNDAKQASCYIDNDGAWTQLYNPDTGDYTPNYANGSPITLTPKVYLTGSSTNYLASCTKKTWYINGTVADGVNYVANANGSLTIKKNLDGNSLSVQFTAKLADNGIDYTIEAYAKIDRSTSASALFQVLVNTPDGENFDSSISSVKELTAVATAYLGNAAQKQGVTFTWERLDGATWTALTAGSDYDNNSDGQSVLTVKADDVQNWQTYRVTATLGDDSDTCLVTFRDLTDEYRVYVLSKAGLTIKNGSSGTDLYAELFRGEKLIESGADSPGTSTYTYTWTKYNAEGTLTDWTGTSSSTKTGIHITVDKDDIKDKCTVHCTVTKKQSS